jgi:excisionase family DNA binding protein
VSNEPLLVSVREAARLLGIGRDACYALIHERRLPNVKIGRRILIPRQALERWVAQIANGDGLSESERPGSDSRGARPDQVGDPTWAT